MVEKAQERGRYPRGQAVCAGEYRSVIALIKASATAAEAKERLMSEAWQFRFCRCWKKRVGYVTARMIWRLSLVCVKDVTISEAQAQSILDMRLQKLTGLGERLLLNTSRFS